MNLLTPDLGSVGKPKKAPTTYLPTYITVYIKPGPSGYEPPSSIQVPPGLSQDNNNDMTGSQPSQSEDEAPKTPVPVTIESEKPLPDIDEVAAPADELSAQPEATKPALEFKSAWSSDDLLLGLDAAEMSYYMSARQDELVQSVATCLRDRKLILFFLDDPREFLKTFADYDCDEESDAAAEEFVQWYVDRFRKELEEQRDAAGSGPAFGEEAKATIERWQSDLMNDERETVIAIDLETGDPLFVRYGDENSVTLHDTHKQLVEGRNVALLHHHPNNSEASLADLDAAEWLKAEFLLVTNPDGTLHRYAWIGETLIPLAPTSHPEYVAPVDPLETAAADAAYLAQTVLEMWNPPERVMEQGEATADDIPLGLTAEQARQSADWKSDWFDNPETWSDFEAIEKRLPIIKEAVERWHHPDSGMSKDAFAALLIANLHQEAHYRRQEPTVHKMSPSEFGLNLADIFRDYFGNQAASIFGHFGILPEDLPQDPTVGPANLRIKVAEEMLGTGVIPLPSGGHLEFDDMGRLDHLERQWQSLGTAVERRRFLENDMNAIELMAANLYRGVERLIDQDLQPTMFNLSAWLSQGIAESKTLRTNQDNKSVTDAINHARATVPFVSAILHNYEAFELKASPDGFIVFNEDDLHAYLRN